jgi:hypothetical protein
MRDTMPTRLFRLCIAAVGHRSCVAVLALFAALMLPAGTAAGAFLDGNEDFKLMASLGFAQAVDGPHAQGSGLNEYAWSMAWFKGKLYVGTGRFETDGTPSSLATMTGQIWAYTPGGADGASGTWALALQSPGGIIAPREFGYRWMTVCNFNGNDYMFVATAGVLQGNILRTSDGVNFTPLSRTGYPPNSVGFRTMVCFTETSGKQMLISTEVGVGGDVGTYDTDLSDNPIVLANDDPTGNGPWRNYSPMRMGDPTNNVIFTMYGSGNTLYAGVANQVTGAQVWQTTGCVVSSTRTGGNCVPNWTKIIDRGAGRLLDDTGQVQNQGISDMMAFGGAIYMGVSTGTHNKPPAEMWRLRADGKVEIVIGDPRFNYGSDPNAPSTNPAYPSNLRCGLPLEDIDGVGGANDCPPTSRRGGGFGVVSNAAGGYPPGNASYFWRLHNYAFNATSAPQGDNRLYTGTLQARGPGAVKGFDILASPDGLTWTTITNDGLGDSNQLGMRTIASSPFGLFVGSANRSFSSGAGPVGCSVWLGSPAPDLVPPVTTLTSPPSPVEGGTLNVHSASFAWTGADTPAAGSLPLTYAYRLHPLEANFSAFGAAVTKDYFNLLNGTYTFYVVAKDAAGNVEAPGAAPGAGNRRTFTVNAADAPPNVAIQAAPSGTSTTGNVTFIWLGSDDVTPPASLVYDFWLAPVAADAGTFVASTTKSYTALPDGAYTFHVMAKDGAGNVGAEVTAAFTVVHPPLPPAAPASASAAVNAPPRGVRVTWTDVATETGYNIQRCQVGRACIYAPLVSNLPADTTFYDDTISAASPAGIYTYRVQACNSGGCSAWVNTNNVTVP